MNKEVLEFNVKLKVQEESEKIFFLEKVEKFEEKDGKFSEKIVTFQVGNKEYRFAITISGAGLFGSQAGSSIRQTGQNLKIIEKKVLLVSWRKKEKLLIGGVVVVVLVGLIIGLVFLVLKNKKGQ